MGQHVHLRGYTLTPPVVEKEIVYYADKRVNHNRVVSLEERLNYLLVRYGRNEKVIHRLIKENFELCKAMEKKLFAKLAFTPDALPGLVE